MTEYLDLKRLEDMPTKKFQRIFNVGLRASLRSLNESHLFKIRESVSFRRDKIK